MNKRQAKEIAKRWVAGVALSMFPDTTELSESDSDKITEAAHEIGYRLLGNAEYKPTLTQIIQDVLTAPATDNRV